MQQFKRISFCIIFRELLVVVGAIQIYTNWCEGKYPKCLPTTKFYMSSKSYISHTTLKLEMQNFAFNVPFEMHYKIERMRMCIPKAKLKWMCNSSLFIWEEVAFIFYTIIHTISCYLIFCLFLNSIYLIKRNENRCKCSVKLVP